MVFLHAPACGKTGSSAEGNVMTATMPCYRHSRGVWIAACDDCTTWHLAAAVARRAQVLPLPTAAAPVGTAAPGDLRLIA